MSMNISGLGNTYNGINTNSKQYKALKEKGWLSGIMQNEAMMSAEERLIYETFGGKVNGNGATKSTRLHRVSQIQDGVCGKKVPPAAEKTWRNRRGVLQ